MWNSAIQEKFLFFSSFLPVSKKIRVWREGWTLGYNSMRFWDFLDLFEFSKILSLNSFGNSWGNSYIPCLLLAVKRKFSIEKSQNICPWLSAKFLLFSMFLLTAPIVKNSHILTGIYFIFLKNVLDQLKSLLIPNLDLSEKIGKVVIK